MSGARLVYAVVALLAAGACAPSAQSQPDVQRTQADTSRVSGSASTDVSTEASSTTPTDPARAPSQRLDARFALPGRFTSGDSTASLRARFGAAQVQEGEVPGAEGERVEGVILFPDDPSRRAYLYFEDAAQRRGLSLVRVLDQPSRWHFQDGIAVGMPLAELVARNGRPVRFFGLDWDYGGGVIGWNGGRLEPAPDAPQRRSIGLSTRPDIGDAAYPMGDGEFSSDDPRYPQLGRDLVVGELGMSFEAPAP